MSATANPYGLRSIGKNAANYATGGFVTRPIASGYATAINFGDLVSVAADGTLVKDTGTTTANPQGVFLGCEYTDSQGRKQYAQNWPAGFVAADAKGKVANDPNELFQIQADGPVPQSAVGANAALVQNAGVLGRSRNALQASSVATTSTLPLRIVSIVEMPENAPGDAFTDVLVKLNNHQLTTLTGI